MPRIEPFEKYADDYDRWFEENRDKYILELEAIRSILPESRLLVEIGVGSGKFAYPLGIRFGIDPSIRMLKKARRLGIVVACGVAEELPLPDESFESALMVTTICFVDDVEKSFLEIHRILKPTGVVIVGFVDRESELGRLYLARREESKFYREASFYSTNEVVSILSRVGFGNFDFRQTIFPDRNEEVKDGYGEGSFIVIKAEKL